MTRNSSSVNRVSSIYSYFLPRIQLTALLLHWFSFASANSLLLCSCSHSWTSFDTQHYFSKIALTTNSILAILIILLTFTRQCPVAMIRSGRLNFKLGLNQMFTVCRGRSTFTFLSLPCRIQTKTFLWLIQLDQVVKQLPNTSSLGVESCFSLLLNPHLQWHSSTTTTTLIEATGNCSMFWLISYSFCCWLEADFHFVKLW